MVLGIQVFMVNLNYVHAIVTRSQLRTKETKEIDWSATFQATDYIVYYGKPLTAISHTSQGLNSNPRQ